MCKKCLTYRLRNVIMFLLEIKKDNRKAVGVVCYSALEKPLSWRRAVISLERNMSRLCIQSALLMWQRRCRFHIHS